TPMATPTTNFRPSLTPTGQRGSRGSISLTFPHLTKWIFERRVYTPMFRQGAGRSRLATFISMVRGGAVTQTTAILLVVGLAGVGKERRPGATTGSMPAIEFRSIFAT